MSYERQNFVDGQVLLAAHLNHMEDGIIAAAQTGSVSDGETETVLSDNLFDKTTVTTGQLFYHSSSGPQLIDSTDVCWAYVPLRGAGTYRTKVNYQEHQTYASRVPILTEGRVFVQNVTGTVTETDNRYAADLEFTITEEMVANGAALYAFDCHTSILGNVMIVKDIEYPSEYIPYGYIEVVTGTLGDKIDNILKGKTALFLGDSLCAGTTTLTTDAEYGYGWGGIIGTKNKMVWKNYGRNGGTIAAVESVAEERWIGTQLGMAQEEYPAADYIMIEGGCNDADLLGVDGMGDFSASGYTIDGDYEIGIGFTAALEMMLENTVWLYPHGKIGYIIPPKMGVTDDYSSANKYRKFFDRAVEVCEKWGVPVLDLWKCNPMNPNNNSHYVSGLTAEEANKKGMLYTDGQHLTLAGYQRIAPQIEAFMRSL